VQVVVSQSSHLGDQLQNVVHPYVHFASCCLQGSSSVLQALLDVI
jgi:hypothetical protein